MKKSKIIKKTQIIIISNNQKYINYYEVFLKKIFLKFFLKYKVSKLPIVTNKITLLTSPHVNKKAQEHFCSKKYKTIITLKVLNDNVLKTILLVLKNKIKGIKVRIKIY